MSHVQSSPLAPAAARNDRDHPVNRMSNILEVVQRRLDRKHPEKMRQRRENGANILSAPSRPGWERHILMKTLPRVGPQRWRYVLAYNLTQVT